MSTSRIFFSGVQRLADADQGFGFQRQQFRPGGGGKGFIGQAFFRFGEDGSIELFGQHRFREFDPFFDARPLRPQKLAHFGGERLLGAKASVFFQGSRASSICPS